MCEENCECAWYENWFDRNYLQVYKHRDSQDAQDQVRLIVDRLNVNPEHSILDLGCGDGRHAIIFRKMGFRVTGLDLSWELLREGRGRYGNLDLIRGDMRAIPGRFDIILSLFTSFGYFESDRENERVLCAVQSALQPDGIFWLDFLNPDFVKTNLVPETRSRTRSNCSILEKRRVQNGRIIKEIILYSSEGERSYLESVSLYSRDDLEAMFISAGIEPIDVFGDYTGSDWSVHSPRTIIYGKRKDA